MPQERVQRKERVLHTRISAALEEEIRKVADGLRVPVSNVVRTLLEDSVKVMGAVGKQVSAVQAEIERDRNELRRRWVQTRDALQALRKRKPGRAGGNGAAAPAADEATPASATGTGVFAWQTVILNAEAGCERCQRPLGAGQKAFLGLSDSPGERPFRCGACIPSSRPERRRKKS